MKTILKNGKIFVEKSNFVQAILIENAYIKKTGSDLDLLKEEADKIIDLKGKTVLPGLNDSHLHLSYIGEAMNILDLSQARSIDEIIDLGKSFLKKHPLLKALKGRGWNEDHFTQGEVRSLKNSDLDKISTDIPVIFDRVCQHLSSSNSKAIDLLDIDKNTSVSGGVIALDEANKPNGIFKEYAVKLIKQALPKKEDNEIEEELLKAMDYCIKMGVTSVGSCDILNNDYAQMFRVIHKIYGENKTSLRYSHQFNFQEIDEFKEYLNTEFKNKNYDGKFLSKGSLKLFKDGSLGAKTALLNKPYSDDHGNFGVDSLDNNSLKELVELAEKNDIQVLTHAIGDGAIESLVDIYGEINNSNKNKLRHSIVHCQITTEGLLKKIADEKLSVLVQPIFLDYDAGIVEERVGKDMARTSYAFDTLYKSDAVVSFSTDAPIEDVNPFLNIYSAVNRLGLDNKTGDVYLANERMSVEDSIDAYTFKSAYNEFKEDIKGKLKPGFLADLIVIDKDIFTIDPLDIKDIVVDMTMIGGKIVYEKR